jgi:hypothetical protein
MNIRKPEAKSAINQFRSFLANAGIDVPLNLMQEGFARSQGFDDWQALCANDTASRRGRPVVDADVVPETEPGSRFRFSGKAGDAVWVRFPSARKEGADVSVCLRPGDDGVSVKLYPAALEDRECLERTYLSYQEAARVDNWHSFDEQGFKPMLWGDLRATEALRFGDGPSQPIVMLDDDVLCAMDAADHPQSEARKTFPREYLVTYSADDVAIVCLDLDLANEENIYAGQLRGAQVDREGVIYLKDGRQLRFLAFKP